MSKECVYKIKDSGSTIYSCRRDAIPNSDYCYLHDVNMDIDEKVKFLKEDYHDDFSGSDLTGAYLKEANLTGINFEKACLEKANLKDAGLTEAYIEGFKIYNTNLINVIWAEKKSNKKI